MTNETVARLSWSKLLGLQLSGAGLAFAVAQFINPHPVFPALAMAGILGSLLVRRHP